MVNGMAVAVEFLSTPSARRATKAARLTSRATRDFYPRPPRGGRPRMRGGGIQSWIFLSAPSARRATSRGERYGCGRGISIHALREEGDQSCTLNLPCYERFLSTPSARRATTDARRWHTIMDISIHALREEGDAFCCRQFQHDRYFYPRPPRGGRPRKRRRTDGER